MKVLIAGGSGLLGRALTEVLLASGHEVSILSRNPEDLNWHVFGSQVLQWDPRNSKTLGPLVEGQDAVINLAGSNLAGDNLLQMRWTQARKLAIRESRQLSGQALTQAIEKATKKPKVFLQASAIGYYGPHGDEKLDESKAAGDDFLAQVVVEWENSSQPVEAQSVRRIILRTGLVLGRGAKILNLLMLPFHFLAGGRIGSGKQYMSWIHMQDWIRAVQFLLEHQAAKGIFNLTAPQPVSNREFASLLGKAMHRPSIFPTPAIALKLALGEASTLALDGQRVLPEALSKLGFQFDFPKLSGALEEILHLPKVFKHQFEVSAKPFDVAAYHSNTAVLKRLTPFPIIVQFHHVEAIAEGSQADFTLWFGPFPVRWVARHHDLLSGAGFTDTQEAGPFRSWVHDHRFFVLPSGQTAVQDYVEYEFGRKPYGWVISHFMWLTLPILFSFRMWRTKRDLE